MTIQTTYVDTLPEPIYGRHRRSRTWDLVHEMERGNGRPLKVTGEREEVLSLYKALLQLRRRNPAAHIGLRKLGPNLFLFREDDDLVESGRPHPPERLRQEHQITRQRGHSGRPASRRCSSTAKPGDQAAGQRVPPHGQGRPHPSAGSESGSTEEGSR